MKNALLKMLGLTCIFVFIDEFTKYLAGKYWATPQIFINNFFKFEYVQNSGIAFSLRYPYYLLIFSNLVLLVLVMYLALKELNLEKKPAIFGVTLLLSGGIGNLIDRVFKGSVTDFISIWKWPTFNLADAFITIGILLIVVFYGRIRKVKK